MIRVPRSWKKAADKWEKKGVRLDVVGTSKDRKDRRFAKLRAQMSPEARARVEARTQEMMAALKKTKKKSHGG